MFVDTEAGSLAEKFVCPSPGSIPMRAEETGYDVC
jgi:hypothetical protein